MALPISFSLLILPLLLIGNFFINRTFFTFVMIGLVLVSNRSVLLNKSLFINSEPRQGEINQDIGTLINQNFNFNDLPITQTRPLSVSPLVQKGLLVQPLPPQALWYTGRYIYDIPTLRKLIQENKLNLVNIKKMNPVFLAYKKNKAEIDTNVSLLCQDQWIDLEPKLTTNRQVIAFKVPELRQLYLNQ
jgi:hypothetical protein